MKKVKTDWIGLSGEDSVILSCRCEIWEHEGAFLGVLYDTAAWGMNPSPIVLATSIRAAEFKLLEAVEAAIVNNAAPKERKDATVSHAPGDSGHRAG